MLEAKAREPPMLEGIPGSTALTTTNWDPSPTDLVTTTNWDPSPTDLEASSLISGVGQCGRERVLVPFLEHSGRRALNYAEL